MRFAELDRGTEFYDPFFGEHFRKTSTTDAIQLTGSFAGTYSDFQGDTEVTPEGPLDHAEDRTRL